MFVVSVVVKNKGLFGGDGPGKHSNISVSKISIGGSTDGPARKNENRRIFSR